jgi:hypothetical protein
MDLRIRIRIHTKMSWIRNTGRKLRQLFIPHSIACVLYRRQDYDVHLKQFGGKLVDARYFTAARQLMQQRHLYPAFIVLSDDPDWTR